MVSQDRNGGRNRPIVVVEARKKKKSRQKRKSQVGVVDLSGLDEINDPVLARELTEIALSGRSVASYPRDIEKGKKRSVKEEIDEADKPSWSNPIYNNSRTNSRKLSKATKKKICLSVILLLVIAAIIGVVFGYFLKDSYDRSGPIDAVISKISEAHVLQDTSSPQHQALQWMLHEDTESYDLSEERITQRYVLAVFFFATGGYQAWYQSNWLHANECNWHGVGCNEKGEVRTLVSGKFKPGSFLFIMLQILSIRYLFFSEKIIGDWLENFQLKLDTCCRLRILLSRTILLYLVKSPRPLDN